MTLILQKCKQNVTLFQETTEMSQLHRSMVLKRELCTRAKLSIFRSVYVLILTYGHECWILNEKVRSRVQAAETGFLRRISGLTLLDKVKSADIRESLNIESLLLRLERSQLRWYGHVTRMSQERTAKKLLCSTPIGRRPRGRPRTRWRDYLEELVSPWHPIRAFYPLLQRIEMLGGSNSSCCPRYPPRISGFRK